MRVFEAHITGDRSRYRNSTGPRCRQSRRNARGDDRRGDWQRVDVSGVRGSRDRNRPVLASDTGYPRLLVRLASISSIDDSAHSLSNTAYLVERLRAQNGDQFEGPGYRRVITRVRTAEGEVSAYIYMVASQLVKSFLFETQPDDPGTLAVAVVVVLSAVILAGYAPARRASRIDPLAAVGRATAALFFGNDEVVHWYPIAY